MRYNNVVTSVTVTIDGNVKTVTMTSDGIPLHDETMSAEAAEEFARALTKAARMARAAREPENETGPR